MVSCAVPPEWIIRRLWKGSFFARSTVKNVIGRGRQNARNPSTARLDPEGCEVNERPRWPAPCHSFELARVLVRLNHAASFIANANHGVGVGVATISLGETALACGYVSCASR